ncbi:unnamed protein product [Aureobasidium vineae]|uniref:Uncharacterized protein n=1 Tax=Aureobasidium vineae TaxID=2773715 RepID=A0A9N8PCJ2_9PEZI|nr:unnamed protein product [Aureobasidium vineae]
MSTSVYMPSQAPRKGSTTSRHRRSTVSLHSTPGLGLIRTISKDLRTGWHTTTALQNEPVTPPSSAPVPQAYKPKYAARDAMKGFTPAAPGPEDLQQTANSYFDEQNNQPSPRSRQDSLAPISPITQDATKPLACVEAGLIPDHSFDTWTAAWDSAYERRINTYHHCPSPTSATFPSSSAPSNSTSSTTSEKKKRTKSTRPPLTGRLSVTNAEVKRFVFGDREDKKRGFESPEAFLMPRRDSEVPSLVLSEVSSRDSGLEDLDEGDEDEQVQAEIEEHGRPKMAKERNPRGSLLHLLLLMRRSCDRVVRRR